MSTLTATQRLMLLVSASGAANGVGHGVGLMGAGNWAVARKLEALGLGWIETNRATASAIGGHFFANADGLAAVSQEPAHVYGRSVAHG